MLVNQNMRKKNRPSVLQVSPGIFKIYRYLTIMLCTCLSSYLLYQSNSITSMTSLKFDQFVDSTTSILLKNTGNVVKEMDQYLKENKVRTALCFAGDRKKILDELKNTADFQEYASNLKESAYNQLVNNLNVRNLVESKVIKFIGWESKQLESHTLEYKSQLVDSELEKKYRKEFIKNKYFNKYVHDNTGKDMQEIYEEYKEKGFIGMVKNSIVGGVSNVLSSITDEQCSRVQDDLINKQLRNLDILVAETNNNVMSTITDFFTEADRQGKDIMLVVSFIAQLFMYLTIISVFIQFIINIFVGRKNDQLVLEDRQGDQLVLEDRQGDQGDQGVLENRQPLLRRQSRQRALLGYSRRRAKSPARRRSKSSVRRRSKSPVRRRAKSPARRRSKSSVRRRSKSPVRRRAKSPARRRSKSPVRRRAN